MANYRYFKTSSVDHRPMRSVYGRKILFVEGMDECILLDAMLDQINADQNETQIISYGGKESFRKNLDELLRQDRFLDEEVRALGVVQDADSNFAKTIYDLKKHMKDVGMAGVPCGDFKAPEAGGSLHFGAFILPNNLDAGCLETLLLKSVANDTKASAASEFVKSHALTKHKADPKRVAQVYLSVQETLCRGAGQGARDQYFRLDAAALDGLWEFLRKLQDI